MLSIAPAVGSGTRADPYKPFGWDLAKTSWISLYDPTTRNPAGQVFLLNHDTPIADARLEVIGADKDDAILPARLVAINAKLGGTSLASRSKCSDLIVELLLSGARCPILQPTNRKVYEIWLAGELIFSQRAVGGGATASDNFGTDQNPVSTTSSGGTWNSGPGDWLPIMAVSGRVRATTIDTDHACSLATPSINSNQFSQLLYVTSVARTDIVGAITRMQGAADASCYIFEPVWGVGTGTALSRVDFPFSFTGLASWATEPTTPVTIRLESNGSSHQGFLDGVSVGSPYTDATYTGGQPGIHITTANGTDHSEGDDFSAGDLDSTTASSVLTLQYMQRRG